MITPWGIQEVKFHGPYASVPSAEKVKGYSASIPQPCAASPNRIPPQAVNMQSAPKPPCKRGRHSCPAVLSVMSSLNAEFAQRPAPPPSLRSPALMLSPSTSRRRAEGGGGASNAPSVLKPFTLRPPAGPQPERRDSVSRVSVSTPSKLQSGSQRLPGTEKSVYNCAYGDVQKVWMRWLGGAVDGSRGV